MDKWSMCLFIVNLVIGIGNMSLYFFSPEPYIASAVIGSINLMLAAVLFITRNEVK